MYRRIAMMLGCAALLGCSQDAASPPLPAEDPAQLSTSVTAPAFVLLPQITLTQEIRLRLNIPANRLDVFIGHTLDRSYPVSVGLPKYPTPIGEFFVNQIRWNPWWIPPPSDWAANEKNTPPGPNNPMGKVKLIFKPYYFLHGTPFTSQLGRAASHGCVRLSNQDAVELALLLQSECGSDVDPDAAARALNTLAPYTVRLNPPVPISVVYDLVEVRDTLLEMHPDIYGRRSAPAVQMILEELMALALWPVDPAAVERFAAEFGGRTRQIPVANLLMKPVGPIEPDTTAALPR